MAQTKTVTGADVSELVVTDTSSGEPAEPEVQTPDSDERLAKLEANLLGFAEKVEQEAAARADAEARAARAEELRRIAEADRDREVKIRIGHQQNTGPKLQELADLKRQQAQQTALEEKIDRLQGLVAAMASNSLQPEDIERIDQQIARTQQTKELERLRTEVQQRSQPAPQQQQAPELTPAWKKQLKNDWFAEFDVDPLDLTNEEWHQYDSRDENHWKSQVRAEFEKRHNAKKPKTSTADEIQTLVAAQVEAQVKATREEDAKRFAETKAELEELKKTHAETQRLAEEQLNRSKGMDRGHESVSETVVEKSLAKELAKNSSLIGGTDADRAEFRKRMDDKTLRDRILDHARQVQAKATK